jgi:hypothetical protein
VAAARMMTAATLALARGRGVRVPFVLTQEAVLPLLSVSTVIWIGRFFHYFYRWGPTFFFLKRTQSQTNRFPEVIPISFLVRLDDDGVGNPLFSTFKITYCPNYYK